MAMSNWDTYALAVHNGEVTQTDGSYTYMDWKLEIYKNWLSITDPKGRNIHYDGTGELDIGKVGVYSMKIKTDIYLACKIDGENGDRLYFVGIGAYGWKHDWFPAMLEKIAEFFMCYIVSNIPHLKIFWLPEKLTYLIFCKFDEWHRSFEPKYVGVTKKQVARLSKFAKDILWKLKDVDLTSGKRICQGDLFFQGIMNLEDQSTPVGEAKDNLFSQMLK